MIRSTTSPAPGASWRPAILLLVILVLGSALRLVSLRTAPPGLNQDEASNAWNAYCILKTGSDQTGKPWPVFYSRCLGENRSTLFLYWMLPFQALGGLNIWTTRLPSAVAGSLTLLLIYYIATRMYDRSTGLMAAGLLAITPWHIQQSRWGHEAAIVPFLVALAMSIILRANLHLADRTGARLRLIPCMLAGLTVGICCYGYFAVRVFLPLMTGMVLLLNAPTLFAALRTPRGAAALGGFVLALAATLGPLTWKHLTDPETSKRFTTMRVGGDDASSLEMAFSAMDRYPGHFGPSFLFLHGDEADIQSPPGSGMFHFYMLPLMLLGLGFTIWRLRTSASARILVAWLLLYPLGDCLSIYSGMHALRSLPGICGLVLLGAVGAVEAGRRLTLRSPVAAYASAAVLLVAAGWSTAWFLHRFFGEHAQRPVVYHLFHRDLVEACERLEPRLRDAAAVVCTVQDMNMPYTVMLVALGHDPADWFKEAREIRTVGPWDYCTRYGKFFFAYDRSYSAHLDALAGDSSLQRVILILRPNDLPQLGPPTYKIMRPDSETVLHVYDVEI